MYKERILLRKKFCNIDEQHVLLSKNANAILTQHNCWSFNAWIFYLMVNKILAVQNCGPSGTTLLQSLLDNHPQILSLPGLHGQTLLIFWEHFWPLSKSDFLKKFLDDYAFYFEPDKVTNLLGLRELGQQKNEIAHVDKDLFIQYLTEELQSSEQIIRKEFITAVYVAYNKSLGRNIPEDPYILYPIHCLPERYAKYLVEDFATVRFLHTVREPVQSIGSLAKHINKNDDWNQHYLLSCVTAQMFRDHTIHVGPHTAYGMQAYVADTANGAVQSRAVRLEDIHQHHQQTLTKICNWLQIPWSDVLTESTYDGKIWHNRPESIRQTGIGTQVIKQQHNDILSAFDVQRLHYLASAFQLHYGYTTKKTPMLLKVLMPLLMYFPFKMECTLARFNKRSLWLKAKNHSRYMSLLKNIKYHLFQYLICRLRWLKPAGQKNINFVSLL